MFAGMRKTRRKRTTTKTKASERTTLFFPKQQFKKQLDRQGKHVFKKETTEKQVYSLSRTVRSDNNRTNLERLGKLGQRQQTKGKSR